MLLGLVRLKMEVFEQYAVIAKMRKKIYPIWIPTRTQLQGV